MILSVFGCDSLVKYIYFFLLSMQTNQNKKTKKQKNNKKTIENKSTIQALIKHWLLLLGVLKK